MCRDCENHQKSHKPCHLKLKTLCVKKQTTLIGEVDQQNAIVKPQKETSIEGVWIQLTDANYVPLPVPQMYSIVTANGDYEFTASNPFGQGTSATSSGKYSVTDSLGNRVATAYATQFSNNTWVIVKTVEQQTFSGSTYSGKAVGNAYLINPDGSPNYSIVLATFYYTTKGAVLDRPFPLQEPGCPGC